MGLSLACAGIAQDASASTAVTYGAGKLTLQAGQSIAVGSDTLVMQTDGNLVMYHGSTAVWAASFFLSQGIPKGSFSGGAGAKAVFQSDGNLVLYNAANAPYWYSNTGGTPGAVLNLTSAAPYVAVANSSGAPIFAPIIAAYGFQLNAGQSAVFGDLSLTLQTDGNLVLYKGSSALWSTSLFPGQSRPEGAVTEGMACAGCRAVFQSDGNFVLYNGSVAYWDSGTEGGSGSLFEVTGTAPYVTITNASGSPLFAQIAKSQGFKLMAGSNLNIGDTALSMQTDGNLVLYQNGEALWAASFYPNTSIPAGTSAGGRSCAGCFATFQADGNLVLYSANGTPYWDTATEGVPGAVLTFSGQSPFVSVRAVTPHLLNYYLGYITSDTTAASDLNSIQSWLGRPMDMAGATMTLSAYWHGGIPSQYGVNVAVPMTSIGGWDSLNAYDMNQAATGGYDQYYIAIAQKMKNSGINVRSIRPGWEQNGNWMPWSVGGLYDGTNQSFANYIATFRRMVNIFRQYGPPGIKIEYCTNWGVPSYGANGVFDGTPMDYWPGSAYVDIVSMDFYEGDDGNWATTQSGGTYNLDWLASFARQEGVKVGFSEWGASYGDAAYITSAANWMNSLGSLFVYSIYSSYAPADQVVTPGAFPAEQSAWIGAWGNTQYGGSGL